MGPGFGEDTTDSGCAVHKVEACALVHALF